jgi:hypothetical protein
MRNKATQVDIRPNHPALGPVLNTSSLVKANFDNCKSTDEKLLFLLERLTVIQDDLENIKDYVAKIEDKIPKAIAAITSELFVGNLIPAINDIIADRINQLNVF